MILDEESFVDLYEVLDQPPAADALTLRRRISELYLDCLLYTSDAADE